MPVKKPTREHIPLYFFIALLTFVSACGLLGSDDKEPLEPGPRNYEWIVDTLHSPPGGYIYDIWGSSPDDVWAIAGGGLNNLWHFNGKEWSVWDERVGPSFYSIYGFAQDDVWMGGNDGKLYHFDGTEWELAFQYEKEGMRGATMRSMWGSSPSNVFVIGNLQSESGDPYESLLLKYNGNNWEERILTDSGILFQKVRSDGNHAYIQALDRDRSPELSLFYQYKNNQLNELFSVPTEEITYSSLNKIGDEIFYVIGDSIYTRKNGKFIKQIEVTRPNFWYQIHGRHQKNLFLSMEDGMVHYNGQNYQNMIPIQRPEKSFTSNSIIFERDVFFIVNDFTKGTNYIYHGMLPKQQE